VLIPGNAAAALVIMSDGKYLLQKRDNLPEIWYPNYWGLWGGEIGPGESAIQALNREMKEELNWVPQKLNYFTRFDFDFSFSGRENFSKYYYEAYYPADTLDGLELGEGSDMRTFSPSEIFDLKLIPNDSFAILLHSKFKKNSGKNLSK
tara:strand:- start:1373 stop:1819 length:447 start_codon:yes stop_codon:yes gene_type:complete